MNREETLKVALAALLHDLGKFWQRAGREGTHYHASAAFVDEFRHLFPNEWLDDIRDGAGNHHTTARTEIEKIVKVADLIWLTDKTRPFIFQAASWYSKTNRFCRCCACFLEAIAGSGSLSLLKYTLVINS